MDPDEEVRITSKPKAERGNLGIYAATRRDTVNGTVGGSLTQDKEVMDCGGGKCDVTFTDQDQMPFFFKVATTDSQVGDAILRTPLWQRWGLTSKNHALSTVDGHGDGLFNSNWKQVDRLYRHHPSPSLGPATQMTNTSSCFDIPDEDDKTSKNRSQTSWNRWKTLYKVSVKGLADPEHLYFRYDGTAVTTTMTDDGNVLASAQRLDLSEWNASETDESSWKNFLGVDSNDSGVVRASDLVYSGRQADEHPEGSVPEGGNVRITLKPGYYDPVLTAVTGRTNAGVDSAACGTNETCRVVKTTASTDGSDGGTVTYAWTPTFVSDESLRGNVDREKEHIGTSVAELVEGDDGLYHRHEDERHGVFRQFAAAPGCGQRATREVEVEVEEVVGALDGVVTLLAAGLDANATPGLSVTTPATDKDDSGSSVFAPDEDATAADLKEVGTDNTAYVAPKADYRLGGASWIGTRYLTHWQRYTGSTPNNPELTNPSKWEDADTTGGIAEVTLDPDKHQVYRAVYAQAMMPQLPFTGASTQFYLIIGLILAAVAAASAPSVKRHRNARA